MKNEKLKTKLIFNVPIPDENFENWNFSVDLTKRKNTKINIVEISKKKRHDRRNKFDPKLF